MDPNAKVQPATHTLEIYTDAAHAKDIAKGLLHTIFFQRTFPAVAPISRDIPELNITLPAVDDVEIEQLINDRATALSRQLTESSSGAPENAPGSTVHAHVAVQFFEKKRKKTYNFFGLRDADEDVCWEIWILDFSLAKPIDGQQSAIRSIMERSIDRAAMKIVDIAGAQRDHIPPITEIGDKNPFPYDIVLGTKGAGLALGGGTSRAANNAGLWS